MFIEKEKEKRKCNASKNKNKMKTKTLEGLRINFLEEKKKLIWCMIIFPV